MSKKKDGTGLLSVMILFTCGYLVGCMQYYSNNFMLGIYLLFILFLYLVVRILNGKKAWN